MARRQGVTSHACACGQVFDKKSDLLKHQATDCILRDQSAPVADSAPDTVPDTPPELAKAMSAAKAVLPKPSAEPPKVEPKTEPPAPDAPAPTTPIIIPYALCDKRIQLLPATRPVFLMVECKRRDNGLEVKSVKPGWK